MSERRTNRINYNYLDKLFAALDRCGIDPRELPRSFIRMAWEAKIEHLKVTYDVAACARCKLPYREDEMDTRYNLCKLCSQTLYRKATRDPRVQSMLLKHHGIQNDQPVDTSSREWTRKMATPTPPPISTADEILERAAKRPR